VLIHKMAAIH